MSRTTRFLTLRPLAGAGLIAGAALMAPKASQAQTGSEAALLNRLAPTVFIPNAFALGSVGVPVEQRTANGEQALLARTLVVHEEYPEPAPDQTAPVSVDGAYGLLGRSSPIDPQASHRSPGTAVTAQPTEKIHAQY